MSSRRWLPAIAAMSVALHLVGMSRSPLPAQDGLKFLRIARQFQVQPWSDVIRGSDQHPLYPALVAAFEPVVSLAIGAGSDAWRIAAQGVSVLAAVALLWPLHAFVRQLFGVRAANLAVLLYAVMPRPTELGHDTLADTLALAFTVGSLCLGEISLRTRSWSATLACGVLLGLGFLTRPEVLVVAPALVLAGLARRLVWSDFKALITRLLATAAIAGLFVGGYAVTKGSISERLSLRLFMRVGIDTYKAKKPPLRLPTGLDDARWDFSPKEETGDDVLKSAPLAALVHLVHDWAEGLGWVLIPLVVIGLIRGRYAEDSTSARRLALAYVGAFVPVVIRHASTLGYLSGRHAMILVALAMPWASAGAWAWAEGFAARRGLSPERSQRLGYLGLAGLVILATAIQLKGGHPSRWGHQAAGRWLAREARPDQAVLDTRGWASFIRGGPGYDYWHVRQALGDAKLSYIVVGADELKAPSRRAETLRAVLAYAGTPLAAFPGRQGGRGDDVRIYRFDRPTTWEGMRR